MAGLRTNELQFSLSILMAIFQVNLGQPVFIEAKDDGGGGDNWTTGAISRAKLQSNHHHQQTNSFFTSRMPFLSPNQQCQSTEGKISHSMGLLTPSSPEGLPALSLTTNSSWLPWGRVAMPLISRLMPVPQLLVKLLFKKIIILCIHVYVALLLIFQCLSSLHTENGSPLSLG